MMSSSRMAMVWTLGSFFKIPMAVRLSPQIRISSGLESLTFWRISAMLPERTIFPASMIPMSVHIWDSSERMWELTRMVFPSAHSSFNISLNSIRVLGSMPEVGSSRIRRPGSWIRALARQSLCFIPRERLSTKKSARSESFTWSKSSSHRFLPMRPERP